MHCHALPHVAKLIWNNHRLRKHVCGLGNKALRLLHTPNSFLAFHERKAKAYLKTALDRRCRDEVCHEYGMKRGGGRVRLDPFHFFPQRTWGQYCFKVGLMLQSVLWMDPDLHRLRKIPKLTAHIVTGKQIGRASCRERV